MIKRIDHVGIVVNNCEEVAKIYAKAFGLKASEPHTLPEEGIKSIMLTGGNARIEIMEPISPEGGVAKFLKSKGEGVHHISFGVDNVDEALKLVGERGVQPIDKVGRMGMAGKVGFIHPKSTRGVLVELCQEV